MGELLRGDAALGGNEEGALDRDGKEDDAKDMTLMMMHKSSAVVMLLQLFNEDV